MMADLNELAEPVSALKLKITSVCVVAVFSACLCTGQPYHSNSNG